MTEKLCHRAVTPKPCSPRTSPAPQRGACRDIVPWAWQGPGQAPEAGSGRQVCGQRQGMS